jgi:hypothetical protein
LNTKVEGVVITSIWSASPSFFKSFKATAQALPARNFSTC